MAGREEAVHVTHREPGRTAQTTDCSEINVFGCTRQAPAQLHTTQRQTQHIMGHVAHCRAKLLKQRNRLQRLKHSQTHNSRRHDDAQRFAVAVGGGARAQVAPADRLGLKTRAHGTTSEAQNIGLQQPALMSMYWAQHPWVRITGRRMQHDGTHTAQHNPSNSTAKRYSKNLARKPASDRHHAEIKESNGQCKPLWSGGARAPARPPRAGGSARPPACTKGCIVASKTRQTEGQRQQVADDHSEKAQPTLRLAM